MTRALAHRGPDDEGFHLEPGVGLGHRRLSIVDLAGGHQPMCNEDGSVRVVFNGEIYNHLDLRERLLRDHHFRTDCDTEVLVHLYEEFGDAFVQHLRGMFALALWDARRRRLLLVRDRFGIKPLYWSTTSRGVVFSSEVKSFLASGCVQARVDAAALPSYLEFRYVAGARTMFEGVRRVLPGHMLCFEDGNVREVRYWSPEPTEAGPEPYADQLHRSLREAVELRLMSDRPLGAFLSGGLDSSYIVGLMAGLRAQPVSTYTVSLEGPWHDEAEHASAVARHFGTEHHPLRVRADASQLLDTITWHLDEPLADAATIPTYLLSAHARKSVAVVLTGEGADELLGGYAKYRAFLYGSMVRRWLGGPHIRLLERLGGPSVGLRRAVGFMAHRDDAAAFRALTAVFDEREKVQVVAAHLLADPEYQAGAAAIPTLDSVGGSDLLDRMARLDLETWLPNDVLLKVDKMSMAHSLEARVPFLDHVFAQLMLGLPSGVKVRRFREKYVLRQAMRPLVPEQIVRRRKHGFTVPVRRWMEGPLRPRVLRALSRERIQELGYWDADYVERLLARGFGNTFDRRQLWTLFTFDVWHRVFVEGHHPRTADPAPPALELAL